MDAATGGTTEPTAPLRPGIVGRLIAVYLVLAGATVLVLAATAAVTSDQATGRAWGEGIVVAAFAALLVWCVRTAWGRDTVLQRGLAALAGVLLVGCAVRVATGGADPGWLRAEVGTLALVMALLVTVVRPSRRA